jgi:3-hydroxypropionyl-CoA synthetase (ADP-forming)
MESACDSFGVSKLVTYGNRSNVDEADILWYLANDDDTKVIGMYFEGLEDGRKFIETAKQVIREKKKPIVVFKNNRTPHAAKQSALHNGSLASSYEVTRGALDQSGIISVNSYEELLGSVKALSFQPIPTGNRIAMVTNGGGAVVDALDHIDNLGLRVATIGEDTRMSLREYFPPTYVAGNPCDLTCVATVSDYKFAIEKLLQDPNVDLIIAWFVPWLVLHDSDQAEEENLIRLLTSLQKQKIKPILVGTFSETFSKSVLRRIENIGIPVYHSVSALLASASNQVKWSKTINCLVE